MAGIRVPVGTRKGAFILTADGKRDRWSVSGPHFAGWEIMHMKGFPADTDRIYASQSSSWFGQIIQRSDDGGRTWYQPGSCGEGNEQAGGMPKGESNKFVYDTSEETGGPANAPQTDIRVVLPHHLKTLSRVSGEVLIPVQGEATLHTVLDALEHRYPMLRGTIRDHVTLVRRPMVRFFAQQQDISLQPVDQSLPKPIADGSEPLIIVAGIAGG